MSAANPVIFLSEMALATKQVAVIHVYLDILFAYQNITIFLIVAGKTGEQLVLIAMVEFDISMCSFNGIGNTDVLVVVALTAIETVNLLLAFFNPEPSALIGHLRQHSRFGYWGNRINFPVVKWCRSIFYYLYNAALIRMGS